MEAVQPEGWGFETEVSRFVRARESSTRGLTKGLLARKNLRVRRLEFNFSHSNCQGSPPCSNLSALAWRTEDYHHIAYLSSVFFQVSRDTSQTRKIWIPQKFVAQLNPSPLTITLEIAQKPNKKRDQMTALERDVLKDF